MIQRLRCAIYTRKSSEEGLEQSFNSLDAQREACEAYVKSQQHEGWQAIATHYDDGGFSGGNMDRPALKDLMTEIQAGKVNVVVVYKVDRLTRSLADFAKLVEQFDKFGVSFVSVTQQFNTTTSMGRLTLNVLLSFAQFEREVTGERIRDKIAASKKKGMWMGGTVPLGYTSHGDHKLVLNEGEAATVRMIFSEFLRLGNVTALRDRLCENNIVSRGGNHFFRGPLYCMLRNPHYIGLIKHKKDTYPGEQTAIIDHETWDKAQALLDENRQGGKRKPRATKTSVLTGLLFDAEGILYTPTHASKNGRRYRYYTSQAVIKKTEKLEVPARIPASDLESAVIDRLLDLLRDPEGLVAALRDDTIESARFPGGLLTRIVAGAASVATTWSSRTGPDREQFLRAIIDRAIIHPTRVEIRIRVPQLIQQLTSSTSFAGNAVDGARPTPAGLPHIAAIDCPFRHVPQGRALRLIVGSNQITTDASRQAILKAIARARRWYEQIVAGDVTGLPDIARREKINYAYVKKIFPLALLSPARVEEFFSGQAPALSLDALLGGIPMQWRIHKGA